MNDEWLIPDASSVPHPLRSTAIARPEHVVLVADDGEWTAARLAERVAVEAARLAARGIGPGMRVVLSGMASSDWVVAFHALGWIGASVAPLSAEAPADELTRDLATLAPAFVVLTQGAPEALADHPRVIRFAIDFDAAKEDALPERFWPWDEERIVVLTSGTTGTPRAIVLTTQQIVLHAFGSLIRLEHRAEDRWLACLPLHHIGGLSILLRCAFYATTVVLHARFVPARVARALDLGQATMASLVPTMLERVLEMRDAKPFPKSLRVILLGGAKTSPELVERCKALSVPVSLTWGMSEAGSQIATRVAGDASASAGSGRPLAFTRVRTNDGLLEIAGPTVGGVFTTRDRGHIDDQGNIHVDGRDDGVIISGGEKIHPAEIEHVLAQHPGVRDVCVLGVNNVRWGERPVALLVARGEAPVAAAELDAWCAKSLSRFKTPDRYVWVDSLVTNVMDKRSRAKLTELLRSKAPELFAPGDIDATQAIRESGREGGALESFQVDEGLDGPDRGTQHAVAANQPVGQPKATLADGLDRNLDTNALTEPHGAGVVRFSVHEGHRPLFGIENRLDAARRHGKKLFQSLVAVLEYPRKKNDAGVIDLGKTHGDHMLEAHDAGPQEEENV